MNFIFKLNRLITTALAITTLLLNACAQNVSSHVTTYQRIEPAVLAQTSKSFTIAPNAKIEAQEFEQYKHLLSAELGPLDFTEAKDPNKAQYRVEFEIQSSEQTRTALDYVPPTHWGATRGIYGYGGRYIYDPFLSTPIPVERTIYYTHYELKVSLFDKNQTPEKSVWEGKASTDINKNHNTKEATTVNVAPYLIRSVFVGFPGENGKTRNVKLPQIKPF
jgi:hypothetical protein